MSKWAALLVCLALAVYDPLPARAGNVDTFGVGSKATALGGAFAAYADDPFAIHYNPAGLTQIVRPVLSLGTQVVQPDMQVSNYRLTGLTPPLTPGPRDFVDHSGTLVVPHMALAVPVRSSLVAGVGFYVPYGLDLQWGGSPEDPGAYNSYHSWYRREVVTPSLAWRVTESLALGAGISLGRSLAGAERLAFAPLITNLHNRQIEFDFQDDANWSLNFGLLYKPLKSMSFGLTYRGNTPTRFKGTAKAVGLSSGDVLSVPAAGLSGAVQNTLVHAETKIDHPEQLQLGVRYLPGEKISLEMDAVWTRWSRIGGYRVSYDSKFLDAPALGPFNPGVTSEFSPRDWKDTTQLRIGVEWQAGKVVALRGSYYYDPSPVPDRTLDFQWADADKRTFALGAGLDLGWLTVDGVLQYTISDGKRELNGESLNLNGSYAGGGTPQVSFSADGHLWGGGLTVSYRF